MPSRLSSPLFVGRSTELAELAEALDAARQGTPRFVVVAGEAGVGKSRLLKEFAASARRGGALVAAGAALPLGEAGPPYAPITAALRRLARELDQAAGAAAAAADRPGDTRDANENQPLSQESHFESTLDLVQELAERGPLIIVLEDLHWADRSTRDLLTYIARLATGSVLMVTSYRSDEVDDAHPLSALLGELERSGLASRIDLGGLDATEIARMLSAIVGERVGDDVVARVHARSEGNPFYAEELFAGQRTEPGTEMPALLRQVVLQRIRRLSEPTQAVLRVMAAIGRHADYDDLKGGSGLGTNELGTALREAVRHAVLRPRHDQEQEAFAFRHALVREAVYEDILPGERAEIHRRIAEAVAARPEPAFPDAAAAHAAELAYHWDLARDVEQALPAAVRAGRAALTIHAHGAANRHFERALALWDRVDSALAPSLSQISRVDLLESSGQAAAAIGDHAAAIDRLRGALALRTQAADPEQAALVQIRLGRLYWSIGADEDSMQAYEAAVATLAEAEPSRAKARAIAAKASALMVRARYRESLNLAEQALTMAREVGSAEDEAYALNVAGVDLAYLDDPQRGIDYLESARRSAEERGDPEDLRRAFVNLTSALLRVGRREEAVRIAMEAAEAARRMGLERTWGRVQLVNAAVGLYDMGRWNEAKRVAEDALARSGAELETCYLHMVLAQLATDQGRSEEATSHLIEARRLAAGVADPVLMASVEATLADLATWQGDAGTASASVDRGLDLLADSDERPLQARLAVAGLAATAELSVSARARRDSTTSNQSRERGERLFADVQRLRTDDTTYADREISAWVLTGRGHLSRIGEHSDAKSWLEARDAWRSLEQPYPMAVAAWRAAEALLSERARRDEATGVLREAFSVAAALEAGPLVSEIEHLARRARIDLAAPVGPTTRPPTTQTQDIGLTAREAEVLGLVATGMTNRQIAEVLFISEKTASVHVSNILGKLGVSSRVEAAGVAFRLRLLAGGDSPSAADEADVKAGEERTFMFTDIAGSTNLVEAIGDVAWTGLLRWHDATLRGLFATYGGEEIDHAGDGFFVAFAAPQAAIGCAVAIQRTLASHRRTQGFAPSVRIGVHRARATRVDRAFRGRGVHEAARIAELAEPDEIVVSRESLPAGRLGFETLATRNAELKGLRGQITLVPVSWR